MPIYEMCCAACGKKVEELLPISAPKVADCPCGGMLVRSEVHQIARPHKTNHFNPDISIGEQSDKMWREIASRKPEKKKALSEGEGTTAILKSEAVGKYKSLNRGEIAARDQAVSVFRKAHEGKKIGKITSKKA